MSLILPEKPTLKIALTGGIRSGKDTVAEYFVNLIDTHFIETNSMVIGFSDGITDLLDTYIPDIFKEGKPRKAYQEIGQKLREFDEDVWINYALKTIELNEAVRPDTHYIFRDLRQPNEAKTLKELGYTIIKVVADRSLRMDRAITNEDNFSEEDFQHETEKTIDLIEPDIIIENNGTLEDLYEEVEDILLSLIEHEEEAN